MSIGKRQTIIFRDAGVILTNLVIDVRNHAESNVDSSTNKQYKGRRIMSSDIEVPVKKMVTLVILGLTTLITVIFLWVSLYHVDKHEFGFTYNRFSGEIELLDRDGWFIKWWPKYKLHAVDERPYQIRITANMSIGDRVLNAKLVRFNPAGIDTFIEWHGRSAGDEVRNLKEIFKCYAFATDGGESCPFITVVTETSPSPGFENGTEENNPVARANAQ